MLWRLAHGRRAVCTMWRRSSLLLTRDGALDDGAVLQFNLHRLIRQLHQESVKRGGGGAAGCGKCKDDENASCCLLCSSLLAALCSLRHTRRLRSCRSSSWHDHKHPEHSTHLTSFTILPVCRHRPATTECASCCCCYHHCGTHTPARSDWLPLPLHYRFHRTSACSDASPGPLNTRGSAWGAAALEADLIWEGEQLGATRAGSRG
jgi:hypothetical protein